MTKTTQAILDANNKHIPKSSKEVAKRLKKEKEGK
jgi:hypothetical protein